MALRKQVGKFFGRAAGRGASAGGLFLARVYAQFAQFVFFVVAARHISVADFAVFSLLFATAMGLCVLAECGWREYVICHDGDEQIGRSFGLAATGSLLITVVMMAGLGGAATLGLSREALLSGACLAAWVPLRAISMLHSGRLTKVDRVHQLSVSAFVSETAGLLAGLLVLQQGYGILALGLSKLVLQVVALVMLRRGLKPVRYIWRRSTEDGAMLAFAGQILISRLASYMRINFSVFAIGAGLGIVSIGLYRAAARIAGALAEAVREPARVMAWTALRAGAEHGDSQAIRSRNAADFAWKLMSIAGPLFILVAIEADAIVDVVLGAKWAGAAPVLRILALAHLVGLVTTLSEPVFALSAQPQRVRNLALAGTVISGVGLVAALPFGLHAVAWAELVANALVAALTLYSFKTHGGIDVAALFRRLMLPVLALAGMASLLWMAATLPTMAAMPAVWRAMALGAGGLAAYSVLLGVLFIGVRQCRRRFGASGALES